MTYTTEALIVPESLISKLEEGGIPADQIVTIRKAFEAYIDAAIAPLLDPLHEDESDRELDSRVKAAAITGIAKRFAFVVPLRDALSTAKLPETNTEIPIDDSLIEPLLGLSRSIIETVNTVSSKARSLFDQAPRELEAYSDWLLEALLCTSRVDIALTATDLAWSERGDLARAITLAESARRFVVPYAQTLLSPPWLVAANQGTCDSDPEDHQDIDELRGIAWQDADRLYVQFLDIGLLSQGSHLEEAVDAAFKRLQQSFEFDASMKQDWRNDARPSPRWFDLWPEAEKSCQSFPVPEELKNLAQKSHKFKLPEVVKIGFWTGA